MSRGISQFYPKSDYSKVRDWNKVQGFGSATDDSVQIRRDQNHRNVTIENSSPNPVGIGITTYYCGDDPKLDFVLKGGQIKHLAINTIDVRCNSYISLISRQVSPQDLQHHLELMLISLF